jgi:hypothetical protein
LLSLIGQAKTLGEESNESFLQSKFAMVLLVASLILNITFLFSGTTKAATTTQYKVFEGSVILKK